MSAGNGPILGNWQSGQWVSYCVSFVYMGRYNIKGNCREEEADRKRAASFLLSEKRLQCKGML